MIVDGESCEELHQHEPGDISIGSSMGPKIASTDALGPAERLRKNALLLLGIGLVLGVIGGGLFAADVAQHAAENAVLDRAPTTPGGEVPETERSVGSWIGIVLALASVVPVMLGISGLTLGGALPKPNELTVYDGWARPKDYRKRAPIWIGLGAVMVLGGTALFTYEVAQVPSPLDATEATQGDISSFKRESEGTGGLGLVLGLLGLVPLVAGVMGRLEDPIEPARKPPKGGHAPRNHKLFEWVASEGTYYINIPPETKGKLALGESKASVEQLRQRFGEQGNLRLKLGSKARGRLLIGQTKVVFQTSKPAAAPAIDPFPREYVDPIHYLKPTELELITNTGALGLALIFGIWFFYFADRTPPPPSERMTNAMGTASFYEEKEEPIPEEETEETDEQLLEQKDDKKVVVEDEIDESKLVKPSSISDAAFNQARGVGVARVLGTYGGSGPGTVYDVIQSTENDLGNLFAQGMAIDNYSGGPLSGEYVAGGGGINATGSVAENSGLQTGEGPAEVGKTDKKERKVGKASSAVNDVFGDVDKKAVSATIRQRMSGLQACYEKALRTQPNLKGKMSYTITINVQGRVTKVVIEEDTVGDASVRSCTEAKIKDWRFFAEGAEESSEVTFSVSFTGA
ncbi:AgmX/PglI C-terminal domain-containing protein [Nannocystaceae bacterium ST9]